MLMKHLRRLSHLLLPGSITLSHQLQQLLLNPQHSNKCTAAAAPADTHQYLYLLNLMFH